MNRLSSLLVACAAVAFVAGCVYGATGGKPALPLSDEHGTERVLPASEAETIAAITNALGNQRYRRMGLYEAAKFTWEDIAPNWHPTNGFQLQPLQGPITNVPLDRAQTKWVPYVAFFYISTAPVNTNQTKVTVRTVLSKVIDGKEPGIHGPWAYHYRKVPPVRSEEESVLAAIADELRDEQQLKSGKTK